MCRITPSLLKADRFAALCGQSPLVQAAYRDAGNGFYRLAPLPPAQAAQLKAFFAHNDFNALSFTDSRAVYQFYCLDHLWTDICRAADAGLTLLNITSEPLSAEEVYRALTGRDFCNRLSAVPPHYDMRSCHCDVMGGRDGYLYSAGQVLEELRRFAATVG